MSFVSVREFYKAEKKARASFRRIKKAPKSNDFGALRNGVDNRSCLWYVPIEGDIRIFGACPIRPRRRKIPAKLSRSVSSCDGVYYYIHKAMRFVVVAPRDNLNIPMDDFLPVHIDGRFEIIVPYDLLFSASIRAQRCSASYILAVCYDFTDVVEQYKRFCRLPLACKFGGNAVRNINGVLPSIKLHTINGYAFGPLNLL